MCNKILLHGYCVSMKKLPFDKYLKTMRYAFTNFLSGENIFPFYASFKVTHKCSLKCHFCNVWMEKTSDLPKEEVFKLLDNIGNSSIIVLSIEGGDPLVRKDLGEILEYAHKLPFYPTQQSDRPSSAHRVKPADRLHYAFPAGAASLPGPLLLWTTFQY